jgi:hypothetical protein
VKLCVHVKHSALGGEIEQLDLLLQFLQHTLSLFVLETYYLFRA